MLRKIEEQIEALDAMIGDEEGELGRRLAQVRDTLNEAGETIVTMGDMYRKFSLHLRAIERVCPEDSLVRQAMAGQGQD